MQPSLRSKNPSEHEGFNQEGLAGLDMSSRLRGVSLSQCDYKKQLSSLESELVDELVPVSVDEESVSRCSPTSSCLKNSSPSFVVSTTHIVELSADLRKI